MGNGFRGVLVLEEGEAQEWGVVGVVGVCVELEGGGVGGLGG